MSVRGFECNRELSVFCLGDLRSTCNFVYCPGYFPSWPIRVCPGYLPGAEDYSCFDQGALQAGFVNANVFVFSRFPTCVIGSRTSISEVSLSRCG